ncbi:hypothetical protein A2617_03840 [Candidatus Daviesbacteria bacterium RIFOXYD1_FULL_41_10]|uniref:Methyltransferase type 11 domain-containing protein n=2 Tax=Candidatus Daviesiibacteriota TaxID=1752718 RepID=A0A1F5MZW4_9BACT|nr:MAG: Methyltransferase type 11 [Candidatus Daviesbacteria bacterium GW2011_GWB1_41_5]OGE70949.1 MAG: hypothetical protein A2617_03840 [Candidatus Daviesbacteria bacterium RIFOXYD1_FULL_41_10]
MLKEINFWVSSLIPQKIYWHLAGLLHPWQAILENALSRKELYLRDDNIVPLFSKMHLIDKKYTVLDIGCGAGRLENFLAGQFKRCIGIDIAPSMIKLAKKYVGKKNVEFYAGNGKDLKNFDDETFDLVFSMLVFQHLPRKIFLNYLKESYRVLKNNRKIFFQISISDRKTPEPPKNHPWALRYYSSDELKQMLKNIGYRNISFHSATDQALITALK